MACTMMDHHIGPPDSQALQFASIMYSEVWGTMLGTFTHTLNSYEQVYVVYV